MATSTRRRITLLDLLTLIAATALGLALLRISIDGIPHPHLGMSAGALAASRITAGQTYASCFLAPWSVALLALDLRGSRSSLQRPERGPGFIACAAATVGVALHLVACSLPLATGRLFVSWFTLWQITMTFVTTYAPLMVAGAWLSLVLDSRWRAEPNWIGWAGRVVGVGWIGFYLLTWLRIAVF